ncbi:MAG: hypothetical protein U0703_08765 [Anaerolineae bacterium]
MLTFGVAGMSAVIFSLVIVRSGELPKALGYLGYLLGAVFVVHSGAADRSDATNLAIVIRRR